VPALPDAEKPPDMKPRGRGRPKKGE
jgi:hypothetical protein